LIINNSLFNNLPEVNINMFFIFEKVFPLILQFRLKFLLN
jgi:hypothetical protein